jgi:hypothetical protein
MEETLLLQLEVERKVVPNLEELKFQAGRSCTPMGESAVSHMAVELGHSLHHPVCTIVAAAAAVIGHDDHP